MSFEEPAINISANRSRRSTLKAVNYSKEQEFSDNDLFEDDLKQESSRRRSTATKSRKSTGDDDDIVSERPSGVSRLSTAVLPTSSSYIYYEKGYDISLGHLRDRFTFMPEYEPDGSPKVDLIVGRRVIQEASSDEQNENNKKKTNDNQGDSGNEADEDDDIEDDGDDADQNEEVNGRKRRSKHPFRSAKRAKVQSTEKSDDSTAAPHLSHPKHLEYEYLVKYKGQSYLHLEWKKGQDLESMNKSAKVLYRRFLKKLEIGSDEDLEDPEIDPSYIQPQKILDEDEHEIMVDLSDKELVEWEKERQKQLEDEENSDEDDEEKSSPVSGNPLSTALVTDSKRTEVELDAIPDPGLLSYEDMVKILKRDEPYYPVVEGSDNPYRDGYITEPPRKPRGSYLFFQSIYRAEYQRRYKGETVAEIMQRMGDAWRSLSEEQQGPFLQLAKDEMVQYEFQRSLMEKAQKPAELWQPLRRCKMVLERLSTDGYASIFLEPVDLKEFSDYLDYVDQPIDLVIIKKRLDAKKYMGPEQFARDMRKVWSNCKIYNQHGSAIWYVADYMSKQFERLFNAWVIEFRERYLRWADPKARPWEQSCRLCDGKCGTPDDKMVLCDHCDAMYGIHCLSPRLSTPPSGPWHCPDCAPKMSSSKGPRMLSALPENAARRRVELGGTPKKKITERLFLVKWAGLGYEYCTWEKQEDVNDDSLIAEFRGMSTKSPDEPSLTDDDVEKTLASTTHLTIDNAGGANNIPLLRFQLYSQVRTFHFLKFGRVVPENLGTECGPLSKEFHDSRSKVTSAIKDTEEDEEFKGNDSSYGNFDDKVFLRLNFPHLPPPFVGEYDAIVPVTSKGLLLNVGEVNKAVAFLGYRQFPDGTKGPAEVANLIKNVGDKIIAVDGVSAVSKSFKEVIGMLKDSGVKQFTHMRFLSSKYSLSDSELTSMGSYGKFAMNKVKKHMQKERRLLLIKRNAEFEGVDVYAETEKESDDESVESGEDEPSEDESEFDDDDLGFLHSRSQMKSEIMNLDTTGTTSQSKVIENISASISKENELNMRESHSTKTQDDEINICKQETTRSLALRLLDLDIGYSSDEAGDENNAYFIDGVDCTFALAQDYKSVISETGKNKLEDDKKTVQPSILPVKRTEFGSIGDRAKLMSAISLSKIDVKETDFERYPLAPSGSSANEVTTKEVNQSDADLQQLVENETPQVQLSKTKIEQVSILSNEVIRVWATVEDASATLQISLKDLREVLKGEYNDDTGDEVSGFKWRYAPENAEVTKLISDKEKDKGKKAFYEFRDKLYDHEKPHNYKGGNRLRDYQIDGINWLASCWYKRHGSILADEMGLGKTVQVVGFIEHLSRVENIHRPHLIVVPLSTVEHWRREFEAWTDLVCCVYHEQKRIWRDVMREYEWYYVDRPHTADFLKFDVLVTTYDTLIADFDVIGQIPWRVSVVDEAHRLRNQKGKLLECMREISGKGTLQYGFQSRILMTGTPLQNNIQELWTLLNFIEPYKFPSVEEFEASYGNMSSKEQVEGLQKKISPFMLRRVKEDVAKDIPSKEETIIDVELTSIQKTYYRAIFERNLAFLNMGNARQSAPKLMNIQMELRKCCNHPFLLDGVEAREMGRFEKDLLEDGDFYSKTASEIHNYLHVLGYIQTSGKMVLLDKLLPKLREEGHKILIFSQMVKMLDILSEYFDFRNFKFERLDGKVRGNDRQKAIDRFNTQPDSFIFMLSTRAGGVGINLTAADIVIIFDSDWNPQNDVQAQARCHRIGQTKNVMIYRLITSRSFEQEMFDRASKKLGLEQAVLGTFGQDDDDGKPTAQEMEQLLKKGAYALLGDENDEITREFCADDIENILAKRTRTRVVEGTKTASWLNKQGLVTKSKFTADSKSATLDVDDPLFWQKVMPDFVTPAIMLKKLDDLESTICSAKKGRGRRRGRSKVPNDKITDDEDDDDAMFEKASVIDGAPEQADDDSETISKDDDLPISKTNLRLINKFFQDLKGLMEGVFDDIEDDNCSESEKVICQKLLLSVSVKSKLFSQDQRTLALSMLDRLAGDRRRKCRDELGVAVKIKKGGEEKVSSAINELLLIKSSKRKKKSTRNNDDDGDNEHIVREKNNSIPLIAGDDGYLHHSDSDEVWSEVAEDPYNIAQKSTSISLKEAKRRRAWASDKDPLVAAGRPWPALPRNKVLAVLTTLIDLIIQEDMNSGGLFSVPVPEDLYPEYYEIIKNPMDYGTIKDKVVSGKYRSAQAMQKDLVLVLSNCIQFNAVDSDIVQEIKSQSLNRPHLLKTAAFEHDLFLAEDGSVLDILPEIKKEGEEKDLIDSRKEKKKEKQSNGTGKIKIKLKVSAKSDDVINESLEKSTVKKRPKKKSEGDKLIEE